MGTVAWWRAFVVLQGLFLLDAGLSNMLTLGLIDLLHRGKRVWQQATFEHTLVALVGGVAALMASEGGRA